uniref:RING-type E3 ubiquitin transferase n=1 Tax=Oryza nivara TaxID=4536 RepID=A0A0E0FFB0_ORYNI
MDLPKLLFTYYSLLNYESYVAAALEDDEDFFETCSSQRCSKHGPEIRFPFRLSTQPSSCGAPGMHLSCSGQDTILNHPVLGPCKVTEISYSYATMNVIPPVDSSPPCPLLKLMSKNQSTSVYKPQGPQSQGTTLVVCSRDPIPANQYDIVGPISCLGHNNQFWYLADPYTYMSVLP